MKKRLVVIGAGLCGSVISARLRNQFHVTVIEQGHRPRPLFNEVECAEGEINTSINRGAGLGGTTNYWHNALIELDRDDLLAAGIEPDSFEKYYSQAWSFFLDDAQRAECEKIRAANMSGIKSGTCSIAHMVVPYGRMNLWSLANSRYPGDTIEIVFGAAQKIVPGAEGTPSHVMVQTDSSIIRIEADVLIVAGGGLSTPVILANSILSDDTFCPGYHDHPMAYVAKLRLIPGSVLKSLSCTNTAAMDVRCGFVYEHNGIKTAFYLRPARNLDLKSISGSARYILSDLRNDPFSIKKVFQLFANLDAVKEAILFKLKIGFRGDYYSVLLLGEQSSNSDRGLSALGAKPVLNWHVTEVEELAYRANFEQFMSDFASQITDKSLITEERWEFRTAAHHSGAARRFVCGSDDPGLAFYRVESLEHTFVCDASLLFSGGIANSGLTLVAMSLRLADLLSLTVTPM